MQHCSCMVFLSGELTSSVYKADVTVAEIAMLRAIHGEDAVVQIVPTFIDKIKASDELERLRLIYGPGNVSKEGKRLIDEVYPGRAPNLPTKLADIDVDDEPAPKSEEPETVELAALAAPKGAKSSKASDALLGGSAGE